MRNMIAFLLGWKVVYLQWHDGEVEQRIAEPTPFGLVAYAYSRVFKIGGVLCLPDGTTKGAVYIDAWKQA